MPDFPQAGAASVTMAGSSSYVSARLLTGAASVSMSGALTPGTLLNAPGAPPLLRAGLSSYFFDHASFTAADDTHLYGGQGYTPNPTKLDK